MAEPWHERTVNLWRANQRFARLLLLFVVIALLAGLLRLSVNGDPSRLLGSNSSRYQAYDKVLSEFPGEQSQVLIYTQAPAFDPNHLIAYESVVKPLSEISGIAAVSSLYSSSSMGKALDLIAKNPTEAAARGILADVKALLSQPDYLLSRLVSAEFDALLMSVTLRNPADAHSTIAAIEKVLEAHYPAESEITWSLAGNPVIADILSQDALLELLRVTAIAMLFGIGVAWWAFRNMRLVVQVVSVPLVAVACSLGLMGWLGIALNLLTQAVLVVVFLVVFTDALHSVQGGRSKQSLILACALTSITTAVAAVALLFARSTVIQEFGLALLTGITTGFVVWVLWLFSGLLQSSQSMAGPMQANWPTRKRTSVQRLITGVLLTIAVLLVPASQLKTGFSLHENLPRSHKSVDALAMAENQFSGYLPLQVTVSSLDENTQLEDFLEQLRGLQNRLNDEQLGSINHDIHWYSINDVLALTPGFSARHRLRVLPSAVRQSLWNANDTAIVFAPHRVNDVLRSPVGFLNALEKSVQRAAAEEGLQAGVITGLPALVQEASNKILPDALRSLVITLMVLFTVVIVVLRSWKLALIASVPVVFGVIAFAAALVVLGEPLRHAGVVMLTLVVGISIDNALHLIVSSKHDTDHNSQALERCMPVLWVATMAIVAGFIALTFSHIPSVSTLGLATAIALAMSFMASALWLPQFLEA